MRYVIAVALVFQVACAVFFSGEIFVDLLGWTTTPLSWQTHELIQIGAAIALFIGVALGVFAIRQSWVRTEKAENALRAASGAFMEVLNEKFDNWELTPAERDVALFSIKGLSIQEIATLRDTSEGTVKAQSNAIYRKAGVSGRTQLLSLFIDDLMDAAPETSLTP